ncbi:MAG: Coenzyme F420 hydrogenase/dehydrogenase, beta subunit C-terminal domain [Rhodospirillales bacterium]|nr:Coenzyme F420 hydrogenase/dehydrogenase, beta subunit C-terminal domain [Rhodospirillales bacterium]MDH3791740.1 Coenzyme F420 hydrogenase/dehydrogenase, beta subunit C-terminal domain [Rhodospirillales bacterium]MDH3910425.1 Coenzyme F420 hydrogenase/dehydrogenase, beta subunit C-terminal domain [Rhodospirillales bacterium]MDH3918270.1 Coenzyme F420 hydrogenase/dehydrogenase, beta subunit C-terminal domain [Rhodospirillales bacterium]MDH3969517.1 Coenzyme F420 hydrogenase/dehydrogenase, bet
MDMDEIVTGGLCIGCGLCQSIAGPERVRMVTTPEGRERPVAVTPIPDEALATINAVCPGTQIEGASPEALPDDVETDPIWGPAVPSTLSIAHASDPVVRYRGAAGGVLTALGQYLLRSGEVELVLHVKASPGAPLRSLATVSETPEAVLEAAASRYGPAAVLEDLGGVLAHGRPLAVIAKPCDIGAVRRLAEVDARAKALIRYGLTLACGGASDLGKSFEVLDRLGVREQDLRLFRYRGHGNPGPTRVETKDGRRFDLTYLEMWGDEAGWRIQPRCKICPDAIGEAADLVSADCWPGGAPQGEDEGFNAVLARTRVGVGLFERAVAAGALTVVRAIGFRDMDLFQPHQVRKKRAVWARLEGMRAAGMAVPRVERLRIAELAVGNDKGVNEEEMLGAQKRARAGRLGEPPAVFNE